MSSFSHHDPVRLALIFGLLESAVMTFLTRRRLRSSWHQRLRLHESLLARLSAVFSTALCGGLNTNEGADPQLRQLTGPYRALRRYGRIS